MKLGNRLGKELVNQPEKCIEHKFDFLFVCFQSSSAHSYNHVVEMLVFSVLPNIFRLFSDDFAFAFIYSKYIFSALKNNT